MKIARMNNRPQFSLIFVFAFLFSFPAYSLDQEASVVLHVHSSTSSGHTPISEIARIAREKKIDAVFMTDLLCERYAYGLVPLQNFLKKVIKRKSVWDLGASAYLKEIENANRQFPGGLIASGVAATPFYYWTGNLVPGPLVLNDRGKDLLVLGLSSAKDYENIPVVQSGRSRFSPYQGYQGSKPYQEVIDYARKKNGFVIWSHPGAHERLSMKLPVGPEVISLSKEDSKEVLETHGYHAIGVYAVELTHVMTLPENQSPASPGGLWDQALQQSLLGRRKEPVWIVGESDYNGYPGGNMDLACIVNQVMVGEKTKENILDSMAKGKSYTVMTDLNGSQRFVLEQFSAFDPASGRSALMAETLEADSAPKIQIRISFSDQASIPYHFVLIRNGEMMEISDRPGPGLFEWADPNLSPGESAYYRLIAWTDGSARLLTNPVFVRRAAA